MSETLQRIAIDKLHASPDNPRKFYGDLSEMVTSIRAQGVIEPPIVRRREDGEYEIVAGHRRARAAKQAGLKSLDVIVRDLSRQHALEVAIVENIARESLNPLELADGYSRLMKEHNLSAPEAAKRVGISRASLYKSVALLELAEPIKKALMQGKLTAASAEPLTSVRGERLQLQALNDALKLGKNGEPPSARAVFRMVRSKYLGKAKKGATTHQREVKSHGVEVALRRRALKLLAERVADIIERKPAYDGTDLRVMAQALAELLGESAREVFQRRGERPDRLSKVGPTQLRGLNLEVLVRAWAGLDEDGEYSPAARAVAKAYGQSLSEAEKTVAATGAAEELFKR